MTCVSDDRISVRGGNRRAADGALLHAMSMAHRRCGFASISYFGGAAALVPRAPAVYSRRNGGCNQGLMFAQIESARRRNAGIRRCYEARLTRGNWCKCGISGDDPIATFD
jgi:hypothetical protein